MTERPLTHIGNESWIRLESCDEDEADDRFIVISDDKLTAFLELERVTRDSLRFLSAG